LEVEESAALALKVACKKRKATRTQTHPMRRFTAGAKRKLLATNPTKARPAGHKDGSGPGNPNLHLVFRLMSHQIVDTK
jgi:hypothetical protein